MVRELNIPPVKDLIPQKDMTVKELVESFGTAGGFTSRKLWIAYKILKEIVGNTDYVNFLSFPAAIIATGLRGVIKELLRRKMFHVVITTCGTLDHDIARSLARYYHGRFDMDDRELHQKGIHRLGNVLIPMENYGELIEDFMRPILMELWSSGKHTINTRELAWEIGKKLDENSLLYWAWKNRIPVYIPGITDGAVGSQLWSFRETHKDFHVDLLSDEHELFDIVFEAKKTGALMIGGGISKHHVIWWNQFRDGLDRAVYITTAPEWDGSLSGARTREAISWGKLKEDAQHITVEGEATVLLPLLVIPLI